MEELLEFDFRASFFELFLGGFGSVFCDAFDHLGGSAFHQFLGVGEAESGSHFAHCLNNSDLVGAAVGDDDIEFGFLFSSFCNRSSHSNCGWRGSGNAPCFFQFFNEIGSFQNGKFAEFFYEFV
jgi:hypothetical protein